MDLILNDDKTEFIINGTPKQLEQIDMLVSSWITLTFIQYLLRGISFHGSTLGYPCQSII